MLNVLAYQPKIVIDPGHGGTDGGGGSNKYWLEKDLNLKISLYQKQLFESLGVKVYMTRTVDKYLSPKTRTDIIKNSGAKHCISNHINSYTSSAKGVEVAHSIHSKNTWSKKVFDNIVKEGAYPRRVFTRRSTRDKNADYYFMHRMTGSVETIIVEYGFASNPEDTQKLLNKWKDYAFACVIATCEYMGIDYSKLVKGSDSTDYYLKKGHKGSLVRELQEDLKKLGYKITVDGDYGPKTEATVKEFQKDHKLTVDGVAGPETLGTIDKLLNPKKYNRVYVNKEQKGAFVLMQFAEEEYEARIKVAKDGDIIELEDTEGKVIKSYEKVKKVTTEVERLKADLEKAIKTIKALNITVDNQTKTISKLESKVSVQEEEIDLLKDTLKNINKLSNIS